MQAPVVDAQRTEASDRKAHTSSLFMTILRLRKFKVLAVGSWLSYWLLYAFSGGMLFFYSSDITPLLNQAQVSNPYFLNYFSSLSGFYNSGIIWYPNGHIQVNLLYGPFIYSIMLSTLFSFNVVLTMFTFRTAHVGRRTAPVGMLALVPALFSGGCCSIPLGLAVVGIIAPTAGLTTLVYGYPFWVNLAFAVLLLLTLVYASRRVAKSCPIPLNLRVRQS